MPPHQSSPRRRLPMHRSVARWPHPWRIDVNTAATPSNRRPHSTPRAAAQPRRDRDPQQSLAPPPAAMPSTSSTHYAARSALLTVFDRMASAVTRWAGSPLAFCVAVATIAIWAAFGPGLHYSENWQLVINTGTTIVTFLMVFLIQQSQNKDSVAIHLKLNELLASSRNASNRMIGIEGLDEQDLHGLADYYARLVERAKSSGPCKEAHSIDEEGMPALPPGS